MSVAQSHAQSHWSKFLQLNAQDRLGNLKRMVENREEVVDVEEEQTSGSWRKLLKHVFRNKAGEKGTAKCPETYNLYDRNPDFVNKYGSIIALEGSDYSPLKSSGVGVHFINLTAVR